MESKIKQFSYMLYILISSKSNKVNSIRIHNQRKLDLNEIEKKLIDMITVMFTVIVREEDRGKGLGRELMTLTEEFCQG